MTSITFKLYPDLKVLLEKKCGPISVAKVLRGLIKALVYGQINIDDLDLSDN